MESNIIDEAKEKPLVHL